MSLYLCAYANMHFITFYIILTYFVSSLYMWPVLYVWTSRNLCRPKKTAASDLRHVLIIFISLRWGAFFCALTWLTLRFILSVLNSSSLLGSIRDIRLCSCSAPVSPAVFGTIGQTDYLSCGVNNAITDSVLLRETHLFLALDCLTFTFSQIKMYGLSQYKHLNQFMRSACLC